MESTRLRAALLRSIATHTVTTIVSATYVQSTLSIDGSILPRCPSAVHLSAGIPSHDGEQSVQLWYAAAATASAHAHSGHARKCEARVDAGAFDILTCSATHLDHLHHTSDDMRRL